MSNNEFIKYSVFEKKLYSLILIQIKSVVKITYIQYFKRSEREIRRHGRIILVSRWNEEQTVKNYKKNAIEIIGNINRYNECCIKLKHLFVFKIYNGVVITVKHDVCIHFTQIL